MITPPPRLLVALVAALTLGLGASTTPAVSATLQPTTLTAGFSDTSPAYNRPITIKGNVSPWGAPTGGGRTVYLRTYMNGNWINVRSFKLTGSAYTITYATSWLGTRKYQVWTPNTSRQAGAWSQQVTVNHHKYWSATTASLGPSPTTVGTNVTMRGRVSSGGQVGGRTVTLYRVFPNGRHAERTTKTASDGTWSFAVPTWFLTDRELQASVAPTQSTYGLSTAKLRQTTKPTYDAAGYPKQHGWIKDDTGYRFRWNGCRSVINVRVNGGGSSAFVEEAKTVLRRAQMGTGIRIRYLGTTSAVPWRPAGYPSDTHLVLAFVTASQSAGTDWDLAGTVVGWGGPISSYAANDYNGRIWETVKAGVAVEKGAGLSAGFSGDNSRGEVLMHEVGHALGLGHVSAESQVMYPSTIDNPRYGAGDLFGLQRAGYGLGGCTNRIQARDGRPLPGPSTPTLMP